MKSIAEADWKKLRARREHTLRAACTGILDATVPILDNRAGRKHAAHQERWRLVQMQNEEIALMFDDVNRSSAFFKLATWYAHGLRSGEDLATFSTEKQCMVKILNSQEMR